MSQKLTVYKYAIDHTEEIDEPGERVLSRAVRQLQEEDFAILSVSAEQYLQVCSNPEHGLLLEYRDGSAERHYRAVSAPENLDLVANAFLDFRVGDGKWKAEFKWEKLDLSPYWCLLLIAIAPEEWEDLNPLRQDLLIELPFLKPADFVELHKLGCRELGLTPQSHQKILGAPREIRLESQDPVTCFPLHVQCAQMLAGLNKKQIATVAKNVSQFDGFPIEQYDSLQKLRELLTEVCDLARTSDDSAKRLVLVEIT